MRSLAIVGVLLGVISCGDDDDGGGAIDAAVAIDAATAIDADPGGPDAAGGPDAGGGGTGAACGGLGNPRCAATHYCVYPDRGCGFDDGTGTCQPRPDICDDSLRPVCGCDGTVHSNSCDAASLGVDLSQVGGCTTPEGRFDCGEQFCSDDVEYCQRQVSDIAGFADDFACRSMPLDCTDCACLTGEPCGDMCSVDGAGNVTLTCPGG